MQNGSLDNLVGGTDAPLGLGLQLAVSALLLVAMIVVHAMGLMAISAWRPLDSGELKRKRFGLGSLPLLGGVALSLFALHLIEIGGFAAFYLAVAKMPSIEEALFSSAAAYATLGAPDHGPLRPWRLVVALEALTGFVFITWSTAFIVGVVEKLRD